MTTREDPDQTVSKHRRILFVPVCKRSKIGFHANLIKKNRYEIFCFEPDKICMKSSVLYLIQYEWNILLYTWFNMYEIFCFEPDKICISRLLCTCFKMYKVVCTIPDSKCIKSSVLYLFQNVWSRLLYTWFKINEVVCFIPDLKCMKSSVLYLIQYV